MSDMIVQCFTCCVTQQTQSKRRRRIDRSMIGSPTNFRHTAHVGSGGMRLHLDSLQDQMGSKGGYDAVSYDHSSLPVSVNIPLVNA